MKLPQSFYTSNNVVQLAQDLLGKELCTFFNNQKTQGIILETEAYAGVTDKASHAYGGRRTKRTETMYARGGVSYVYLCYGMYPLFNVVTNVANTPHAVLIRAIFPTQGIDVIKQRLGKEKVDYRNFNGPGKLTKALGIDCSHNATSLLGDTVWIEDNGIEVLPVKIQVSTRIGVDYAGEDANLPYRFFIDPPTKAFL